MFIPLLVLAVAGAAVHFTRGSDRSRGRGAELLLRWVLVAYCGVPMVVVAVAVMVAPAATLARFGFEAFQAGGPIADFLAWAYLGLALAAVTAVRGDPGTLLAPALAWITFFLGATTIHLHAGHGGGSHGGLLILLASHLLISVLLGAGLLAGGARRPLATSG